MKQISIILGSDHGGFKLKEQIRACLQDSKIFENIYISQLIDVGTYDEQSCDYPDFVKKAAIAYKKLSFRFGGLLKRKYREDKVFIILCCSSGAGVCMAANKYKFIRAVLCLKNEQAALSREHNNANCICFGQKFTNFEEAKKHIEIFLTSHFEAGRHVKRIRKM
jgi:ribose 5-phosphate isomerase B